MPQSNSSDPGSHRRSHAAEGTHPNGLRPLRVCHLGKYYAPAFGGIESHVGVVARSQVAAGAEVDVCCIKHQPGLPDESDDHGVRVRRLRPRVEFAKLAHLAGLRRILQSDYDVFHVHVPNPTMIVGLLRTRPRRPIVVTYHSDYVRQRLRGLMFRPLEDRFYRMAAGVIASSAAYAAGSRTLRRIDVPKRVIPFGIPLDDLLHPPARVRELAVRIAESHPGPLWVSCGRLVYYKGFPVAVEAMRTTPGTLLIIGDGPERPRLAARIAAAGLSDRVRLVGHLATDAEVHAHLLAARAFWLPSTHRSEAFGLVQVEAMAAGCPVINTAIRGSGVPEVSVGGVSGLTVAIDDPHALSQAARLLATDDALHARLAAGAQRRASEHYDVQRMTAETFAVYRQVLQGTFDGDRSSDTTRSVDHPAARLDSQLMTVGTR